MTHPIQLFAIFTKWLILLYFSGQWQPTGEDMQNTSHAVMAQRTEARDSPDDFPTPPWATRALVEYVLEDLGTLSNKTCLEPACGAGNMVRVLKEYFADVTYSDAYDYRYGPIRDFLTYPFKCNSVDWVITNPPFRLGEKFIMRALNIAKEGTAILARTVFIESIGRYRNIFEHTPPTIFAQFTERVPMVKGRLDRGATTATGYAWLIWQKNQSGAAPRLVWIPPCRKALERDTDYRLTKAAPASPA